MAHSNQLDILSTLAKRGELLLTGGCILYKGSSFINNSPSLYWRGKNNKIQRLLINERREEKGEPELERREIVRTNCSNPDCLELAHLVIVSRSSIGREQKQKKEKEYLKQLEETEVTVFRTKLTKIVKPSKVKEEEEKGKEETIEEREERMLREAEEFDYSSLLD